ncbi:MAG: peptide ABC transporter substrate-binding protein [Candidatus Dormibacteraeota bacterium]|uniref:Peptide ABC transporter substrate-binding protein n=1 Tax=Candidatus Amunia macphersoniae TaxID=3127014 RepID=A0A934NJR7_9BACT|nr:peptide ABC transporter substrate-binding protein [Candidatus Dormibacteraeota bacterium]
MKHRRIALALAVPALIATACGGGGGASSSTAALAPNQVLRFPLVDDIKTLDPGHVSTAVDIAFVQNVFGGLYKFDDSLKEVPYIATGMPDISSDGLTYTFKLRQDVKFSNGDPVTSKDVLYSWNRAARLNDSYGIVMQPVDGYTAVAPSDPKATPTATTLSGLSAPDQYTVKAKLSAPAGYWITELALWTTSVVDQKVIPSDTDKTWWGNPATAVGTGPYKLTAYVPKDHLSFTNVANWWGGSTGHLTDIEASVLADQSSQVTKYKNGGFDMVGPADQYPPLDAVRNFQKDPSVSNQLVNIPGGRTTWVGFNFKTGPFAPDPAVGVDDPIAKAGRRAFSEAIDRTQLTNVACGPGGITCKPATGGVISKGLQSYLGDKTDPLTVFDATKAKADLQTWDPTGSKRQGLQYWYNASSSNKLFADNLQSQWQTNLGVKVDTQSTDFPTFLTARQDKKYILFRDSWGADYDNPQDWFDNLFICSQAATGLGNNDGICDQRIDTAVVKAEKETGSQSISDFTTAAKQLRDDVAYADLSYGANQYFIKPYVQGGGGNALYDNSWTGISILAH